MTDTVFSDQAGRMTMAIALALLAITLSVGLIDDRTLNGVSVWIKPSKFNFSFAVHVATLLVFLSFLRNDWRKSRLIAVALGVAYGAILLELFYIALQAMRGRASHFNRETPWEAFAYNAMGAGVALVMLGTLVLGLAVWRRARPDIGPGLRIGVGLGTVAATLTTLITAGAMSSMQLTPTGHWVGGDLSDAAGVPILGWSTTGGDLRVPHFFATHLLQVLPFIGWLVDRFRLSHPRWAVWGATLIGLAVVWVTFEQALSGQPLIALAGLRWAAGQGTLS